MLRVAFLASNNGTAMQAVVHALESGEVEAQAVLIVSNKADSNALRFGRERSIPVAHIPTLSDPDTADETLCRSLKTAGAELVILSGYLRKLGAKTLAAFDGRILNVHPALLPKYGGQGMYGRRVHEAVLAAGDAETGASIHVVDGEYDHGRVIARRTVPIAAFDTASDVERRVMTAETHLFIEIVSEIVEGRLAVPIRVQDQ